MTQLNLLGFLIITIKDPIKHDIDLMFELISYIHVELYLYFSTCTKAHRGYPWCATQVDTDKEMRKDDRGEWFARCGDVCGK